MICANFHRFIFSISASAICASASVFQVKSATVRNPPINVIWAETAASMACFGCLFSSSSRDGEKEKRSNLLLTISKLLRWKW